MGSIFKAIGKYTKKNTLYKYKETPHILMCYCRYINPADAVLSAAGVEVSK
jgi:hypothetical protein